MAPRTSRTPRRRTANRWAKMRFGRRSRAMAGGVSRPSTSSCRPNVTARMSAVREKGGSKAARPIGTLSWRLTAAFPELAHELDLIHGRELPERTGTPGFRCSPPMRKGWRVAIASAQVQDAIAKQVPWVLGGSADLAPSTKTRLTFDGAGDFQDGSYEGRNLHFGIREHAMGSMLNGIGAVGHSGVWLRRSSSSPTTPRPDPTGGADGTAGDLRVHPRFHWRGRGRPDAPAGRAARIPASHPRACSSVPRTPTRWSRPGGSSCRCTTGRPPSCSRARPCPRSTGRGCALQPRGSHWAPTCCPTRRVACPRSSCWPRAARSRSACRRRSCSRRRGKRRGW